jgi:predicted metal-dependent peptidase
MDNAAALALATRLKKANIALMRHPETRVMAGIFVSGETRITDAIPTACTDGWNKSYNPVFMAPLSQAEVTGIVLHENLHVFLKHITRFKNLMKTDGRLINAAMDYAINAFIHALKDKSLAVLPTPHLYNPMFDGMGVMEIYDILKRAQKKPPEGRPGQPGQGQPQPGQGQPQPGQGQPQPGQGDGQPQPGQGESKQDDDSVEIDGKKISLDTHDSHEADEAAAGEGDKPSDKEIEEKIDRAIQQGAILAGVLGQDIPRVMQEAMEVPIRWEDEMQEFINSSVSNADDYSYVKLDRRYMAGDDPWIVPTLQQECVSEVILALDSSGSITDKVIGTWAATAARICAAANPQTVRVIWWDARVHSEQVFDRSEIADIAKLLKPAGGGGTRVSCVAEYIKQRNLTADCVIVLTDGYVEYGVVWDISIPTLWTVTEKRGFRPPAGRVVKINN